MNFDYQTKGHPSVIRNAYKVRLPALNEQRAIATILSDMDAEIAAVEAGRDKIRALKQGMMQELLTGRIRLVEPKIRRRTPTRLGGRASGGSVPG